MYKRDYSGQSLFSDELLPEPDADLERIIADVAADDSLRANVVCFLNAAFVKGLPQLL